ncbi:hypothetical protein KDL01_19485 [Actinospica durhamensis]|uniref:Uncharacterized protein n=1 Tax=Actinospica durhamensis TaxID=1508375 RepID=A0A941IRM6_9ACTN|nr:hypothetical protein [Actinospica durhamensis]MBR7835467.1 hypothetical protein [Actinospica durhamensis]
MSTNSRAAALSQDLPIRILGVGLLLCALDPARVSTHLEARWILSALALLAGFWAAPPLRERPALTGYRLSTRIARYRNTLLPCVSVLVAAADSPPAWLMVVTLVLLLTYLSMLDLFGEVPGTPLALGRHAVAAWIAAGVVLGAALAPISGGWWGRLVAAGAVLAVSALMYGLLRLGRPATFHAPAETEAASSASEVPKLRARV